jgi:hypothetical protein
LRRVAFKELQVYTLWGLHSLSGADGLGGGIGAQRRQDGASKSYHTGKTHTRNRHPNFLHTLSILARPRFARTRARG